MKSTGRSKAERGRTSGRCIAHEVEGGASGALAGAAFGAAAGLPGMVAGAVMGGIAGALSGVALDIESLRQTARTRALDAEIGVSEGELGAPNLDHLPAKVGAYSAASAGTSSSSGGDEPAEGPIPPPPG
jgi:hypothetical protein